MNKVKIAFSNIVQPPSLPGSKMFSSFQSKTTYSLSGFSHCSLFLDSANYQHALYLWICLCWIFYINFIIQHVSLCDWYLSLSMMLWWFIYIIAFITTLFFTAKLHIYIIYKILFIISSHDYLGCFHLWTVVNNVAHYT